MPLLHGWSAFRGLYRKTAVSVPLLGRVRDASKAMLQANGGNGL